MYYFRDSLNLPHLFRVECDPFHVTNKGHTALHLAAANNRANCVRTILSRCASKAALLMSIRDGNGETAIQIARRHQARDALLELRRACSKYISAYVNQNRSFYF